MPSEGIARETIDVLSVREQLVAFVPRGIVPLLHLRYSVELSNAWGSVHGERANITGLVLGCIEADFCK